MAVSTKDRPVLELGGRSYRFRTPTLYDPAKARRILTRQGVRRPSLVEFRVAALAGIEQMAEKAGEPEEGERQRALVEEWYDLLEPIGENDIDEPDPLKRGEELLRRQTAQKDRRITIFPQVRAIESNLERHFAPYGELVADREYWDDISRIEIVRLLLEQVGDQPVTKDDDGMMTPVSYDLLPKEHRMPLATFAFGLLSPDEAQRKN